MRLINTAENECNGSSNRMYRNFNDHPDCDCPPGRITVQAIDLSNGADFSAVFVCAGLTNQATAVVTPAIHLTVLSPLDAI